MNGMTFGILDCFMISFVCGLIFGIVYEFFRLIRRLFDFKPVVFLCDVCFFIAAALFVVQLSLYLGNYIRLYTILGFGLGIFAYIQTLGRIAAFIENIISSAISKHLNWLWKHITSLFKTVIGFIAHNLSHAFGRFHDFSQKRKKSASTLLHFNLKQVYNVKRNIINYGENIEGNHVIKAKIRRSS